MGKDEIIDTISKMTDLLYQDHIEYACRILKIILLELERLMLEVADADLQIEFRDNLANALLAMEENDYVLMADIFQYEIAQCVERI